MKKLIHFIKKNYYLLVFSIVIIFVAIFSFYKIFTTKPTFIYVKVKLGQGLWWATTAEPPAWLVDSIKKSNTADDLPVKVLEVRHYPFFSTGVNNQFIDQYNTYLSLKLKVTGNKNANNFSFNRSSIAIGAPIDLDLSKTQISGTIISFSKDPIKDIYLDKDIELTKTDPFSWENEAIKIGDYYFDGEEKVFEITGKQISEDNRSLTVKAKIKLKRFDNQLIFAEDRVIAVGTNINIFTNNFSFNNYVVSRID